MLRGTNSLKVNSNVDAEPFVIPTYATVVS